jgi:6-phosphogluconolactonase
MLSDDRHVPYDSPHSNYAQLAPALDAIDLPEDRRVVVSPAGTAAEAAEDYARRIDRLVHNRATFSVAVLGVGADGHTAGLFDPAGIPVGTTDESIAPAGVPWATATMGSDGLERVTTTPALLLRFKRLLFFATGEAKREIIYDLARNPQDYAAGRLAVQHPNASVWTDVSPNDE